MAKNFTPQSPFRPATCCVLWGALVVGPAISALAQAPVITTVSPMANARAADRRGPITVTFSQDLTAASAGALQVFSAQRGGRRTQSTLPVVTGPALAFTPTYPFMPGERVQFTVTQAAASGGGSLAQPRVSQFITAAGGSPTATFQQSTNPTVGDDPSYVALGDVDGDGDLDLVAALASNRVGVRLNNGSGQFSGTHTVAVGRTPWSVVLGDLDGDGDLDLLTGNAGTTTVSVRFNNGSGTFSGSQEVTVGSFPRGIALGDVDGDGDLDLVAANSVGGPGSVSVRRNDGSGLFSGGQEVSVGLYPYDVALGDMDGDGDLDLVSANANFNSTGTACVRLNDGTGSFSGTHEFPIGSEPYSVALGDLDGDGDLDIAAASYGALGYVYTSLNTGNGTFGSSPQSTSVGTRPRAVALADVDGDGDLDILASMVSAGTVRVCTNDGSAAFSSTQTIPVRSFVQNVAVGDVDGDGDVDLATANDTDASIRLNGGTGPLAAAVPALRVALAAFPNPAHGAVTITGAVPRASLTVVDALGRPIVTATADAGGTATLSLPTSLPAGVYFVRGEAHQACALIIQSAP